MKNKNVTLVDVRNTAMEMIELLRDKTIDVSTAKEVRSLLDTITATARVQIEFLNALPKELKEKMTETQILKIVGALNEDAKPEPQLDDLPAGLQRIKKECSVCLWRTVCKSRKKCQTAVLEFFEKDM